MPKDYYNILGVEKGASQDEIKKAFRKKAHAFHPDKPNGDEQKFKELNEAFQVLGNEEKRQQYDQYGQTFEDAQRQGGHGGGFGGFQSAQGMNFNFEDLGDLFGGMFGGQNGQAQRKKRGHDIQVDVEMSVSQAILGTEKEFNLMKLCECENCNGSGAEKGSEQKKCSPCDGRGQVTRTQRILFGNVRMQEVCGDCHGRGKKPEKQCKKCDGTGVRRRHDNFKVVIPAGINHGQQIKIAGRGEAAPFGGQSGDLYVRIHLNIPKRVSRKARKLLEELEKEL